MMSNTTAPNVCVQSNNGSEIENTIQSEPAQLKTVQALWGQFSMPQYNTTVRTQDEVAALQNMCVVVDSGHAPLCSASIAPKVNQKLNFAPSCALFTDLTPLNVNDSLRELDRPNTGSCNFQCLKKMEFLNEPQLMDYVEKLERVEFLLPEPVLELDFESEDFDFMCAYNKIY